MQLRLGPYESVYQEALETLRAERCVDRIWSEDATFWKSEEAHRRTIENALGWLTVSERIARNVGELQAFVDASRSGVERVVVLGMGGSSLAPLVFSQSFPRREGFPRLGVLDSTDPKMVHGTLGGGDLSRTIFVVSPKSGTTLEPNILFDFFFDRVARALGERAGNHFIVITDPGSKLEGEAAKRKVKRVFAGDPRIGGRYSALSNFGLVPAAFLGVDVVELLRRSQQMAQDCNRELSENPGAMLGAAIGALARAGRDKVTFAVGRPAARFGMWIEQLIAESTGKEGKGVLPVEDEALTGPAAYGGDRFFAGVCRPADRERLESNLRTLGGAGHPTVLLQLSDALDLGAEMFRWEFATAVCGKLLGINPFDQPNVQEAKDRTVEILEGKSRAESGDLREPEERDPRQLLSSVEPGDYFAITAYLPSTRENEEKLNRIRLRLRDSKRVATTVGFGPRFLHSTGQLHKGGPETGVFLQITTSEPTDVSIPGKPYSFGQVIAAQAAGDLAALKARGRRALSVHLEDASSGLEELDRTMTGALSP